MTVALIIALICSLITGTVLKQAVLLVQPRKHYFYVFLAILSVPFSSGGLLIGTICRSGYQLPNVEAT
jgi:hypothetical protein